MPPPIPGPPPMRGPRDLICSIFCWSVWLFDSFRLQVPDRLGGVSLSLACAVPRPSVRSDTIPTATTAMFIALFADCSLIG